MIYRLKTPYNAGSGETTIKVVSAGGIWTDERVRIQDGIAEFDSEKRENASAIREALMKEGWQDLTDFLSQKPAASPESAPVDRGPKLATVMLHPAGRHNAQAVGNDLNGKKFVLDVREGVAVVYNREVFDSLAKEGWFEGPSVFAGDLDPALLSGVPGSSLPEDHPAVAPPSGDDLNEADPGPAPVPSAGQPEVQPTPSRDPDAPAVDTEAIASNTIEPGSNGTDPSAEAVAPPSGDE